MKENAWREKIRESFPLTGELGGVMKTHKETVKEIKRRFRKMLYFISLGRKVLQEEGRQRGWGG